MRSSRVRALMLLAAIAAVMALPIAAQADHCNGTVTDIGGLVYVDDRGAADGNVWLYLESNGVVGLQSGGTAVTGLYADDCAHDAPDTLIY